MGTSLAVQWLRLRASTAGGMGSIPGQGTKIPHAALHGQKKEKGIVVSGPESYPRRGERKREDKDCRGSCPSQPLGDTSILSLGFLICKVGLPSTCPGWRRPCAHEAPPPGARRTDGEIRLVQMSFTEPSLAGQVLQPPAVLQVAEPVSVVGPAAGGLSGGL